MNMKVAAAAVIVAGWMSGAARADFHLHGDEQLIVDTVHTSGGLYDQSQASIVSGGFVKYLHTYGHSMANLSGGEVSWSLSAYDSSAVNVTDGTVYMLYAEDSSSVNMSGGSVGELDAYITEPYGQKRFNISGGYVGTLYVRYQLSAASHLTISEEASPASLAAQGFIISEGTVGSYEYNIDARGTSSVAITGGSVSGSFTLYDSSKASVSGGSVGHISAVGHNEIDISGGCEISSISAGHYSTVNVAGGALAGGLIVSEAAAADIFAGSIAGTVTVSETGTLNVHGGTIAKLTARSSGKVDITGGSLGILRAGDTSAVTLHGWDFILGDGLSLDGQKLLGTGVLSGKWLDGTPLSVAILANQTGATILLVPEPTTISLLLAAGCAGLLRRRGS
jgi:hypothetical protein